MTFRLLAALSLLGAAWSATEEVETPKEHYARATQGLTEAVNTLDGNVLLVWLVDMSASMQDDRQEIRDRIMEMFRKIRPERVSLRMAVVGFGREATEILPPSGDPKQVMKALTRIPVDGSGIENCVYAVSCALKRYATLQDRKIIVLVTDERGNDDGDLPAAPPIPKPERGADLETVLDDLKKAHVRFFCFGREACFCSHLSGENEGVTDAGPETAQLEAFSFGETHDYWRRQFFGELLQHRGAAFNEIVNIPSGFGNYAQARLCKETGGTYYLFRSGAMRTVQVVYDKARLEKDYAPFLGSRQDFPKQAGHLPLLAASLQILKDCRTIPPPILTTDENVWSWLNGITVSLGKRQSIFEKCIQMLEETLNHEPCHDRRAQANAELILAQMKLELYEMLVLGESIQGGLKHKPRFLCRKEDVSLEPVSGKPSKKATALYKDACEAFKSLGLNHPNTPWETAAQLHLKTATKHRWDLVFRKYGWGNPDGPPTQ